MFTTSVTLLQRLRQPEAHEAWARFVNLYTPLLYYWVRRLGLQEEDAADLVQDVLTNLVQKLPEFEYDTKKSFRAWLRTVTLNRWRNNLRRRSAQPMGSDAEMLADPAADDADGLEEAEYRQYLVGRALQLMQAEFQPATWKMFWEHVVVGRSPAEVAADVGVSIDSVYAAKSRILRRLRQELDGLLE
jgi:RNA polymerase sigma-70 factor (ECF subfamily)